MAEPVKQSTRTEVNTHPDGRTDGNGRVSRLKKWAFRPGREESKPAAALRSFLRILFIVIHEFNETGISLRASALTYSIVLSMVPLLAMSTAILKGLGSDNQLKIVAYRMIDQLDPQGEQEIPGEVQPGSSAEQADQTRDAAAPQSMATHLRRAVDTIFDYVDKTNFAALGAFGIAGLLLVVVLVLSAVEDAMNAIWHSRQGRPFSRKIMNYLALLVILPITINVAIAGEAILGSPDMLARLHSIIPWMWVVKMLLNLLPFFFFTLTLMAMYMFFANVWVKTSAAFTGALFAGIFWFIVQKLYIILQIGVARYNAIYGTFAAVPLFLIWVHLGWTFILLGALLSYAIQNRNQYNMPGTILSPQRNLQLAFDILNTVYSSFARKESVTLEGLAAAIPTEQILDIRLITDKLIEGGFLHRIDETTPAYVPAEPADKLTAGSVVQLIFGHEHIPTIGGRFSDEVLTAAESAIPGESFPLISEPGEQYGITTREEVYERKTENEEAS